MPHDIVVIGASAGGVKALSRSEQGEADGYAKAAERFLQRAKLLNEMLQQKSGSLQEKP